MHKQRRRRRMGRLLHIKCDDKYANAFIIIVVYTAAKSVSSFWISHIHMTGMTMTMIAAITPEIVAILVLNRIIHYDAYFNECAFYDATRSL